MSSKLVNAIPANIVAKVSSPQPQHFVEVKANTARQKTALRSDKPGEPKFDLSRRRTTRLSLLSRL
jgi:hypothetical protein